MLGYTLSDLYDMSNAVHNAYKYVTEPKVLEGLQQAHNFLEGLWTEGYFD